jgi:WD40 repeat protein
VWDAQTVQEVLSLKGHTAYVSCVAFSPDGKRIASGAGNDPREPGEVKVWDAQTGKEILNLKDALAVSSVAFSPDGTRLASGSDGGTAKVWDVQTGQQVLDLKGHTAPVNSVGFSPDGKRVIAASVQGEVRAWNPGSGQPIVPCTDPPPRQQALATSPDGQRLVRIVNGQPVVEPRFLRGPQYFQQCLQDEARTHLWHLRMAREALQGNDAFALHFHLRPLLLTAFTRWQDRPHAGAGRAESLGGVGGTRLVPSPAR